VRRVFRHLLFCFLFLAAGLPELCASIPKTRVGNFFAPSFDSRPETSLQVPQLRLDNPLLYGELASGRLFWSKFDPEGLEEKRMVNGQVMSSTDQHRIPVTVMQENNLHPEVAKALDDMRVPTKYQHGAAGHAEYSKLVNEEVQEKIAEMKAKGMDPTNSAKKLGDEAKIMAKELEDVVTHSKSEYVREFDKNVRVMTQDELKAWGWAKRAELVQKEGKAIPGPMRRMLSKLGVVGEHLPGVLKAIGIGVMVEEFSSDAQAKGVKEAARTQYYRYSDIAGQTPEEYKETQQKASKWFGDKLLPPLPDE
jgi:hypothetical protein